MNFTLIFYKNKKTIIFFIKRNLFKNSMNFIEKHFLFSFLKVKKKLFLFSERKYLKFLKKTCASNEWFILFSKYKKCWYDFNFSDSSISQKEWERERSLIVFFFSSRSIMIKSCTLGDTYSREYFPREFRWHKKDGCIPKKIYIKSFENFYKSLEILNTDFFKFSYN